MVTYIVFWMNAPPVGSVLYTTFSPRIIMVGTTINFNCHCRLEFGAYAEVHEYPTPNNSQQYRTEPVICLGPTRNIQGSYWLLNLRTGFRVKRHYFTPLLDPPNITDHVHQLTAYDKNNLALFF